ncbi:MAG: organic hydroperoxide resistance protein [Alphaproteobacteria bacterium]|nr:organic hydroperoxide resistance protein [Alphaproteobacteria bacterium]
MAKTLYTAKATAISGREGHAETDDKKISVDLSPPGSNGKGTNPEQLFACGYGACFGGALGAVAKKMNLDIGAPHVNTEVNLNQDDNGGYFISAVLDVQLTAIAEDDAKKLIQKAHEVCPYSKATRGNIEMTLKLNGQAL